MEALRVGLAEAERSHNLFAIAGAHNGFADIAMHVNDLETAREHLERAVAMYEAQGDPTSTTIPRRYLAFLSLAAGKPEEARRQVLEVLEFYRSTNEATDVFDLHRMLAAIALRESDWGAAPGRSVTPSSSPAGSGCSGGPTSSSSISGFSLSFAASWPRPSRP